MASRTHFEFLGLEGQVLGLEASSSRKLPCPRLEDSSISGTVEISLENARNLPENLPIPFFVFLTWSIGVAKRGGGGGGGGVGGWVGAKWPGFPQLKFHQ